MTKWLYREHENSSPDQVGLHKFVTFAERQALDPSDDFKTGLSRSRYHEDNDNLRSTDHDLVYQDHVSLSMGPLVMRFPINHNVPPYLSSSNNFNIML